MRKIILAAVALAGLAVFGGSPGHAYGNGPWCAVSSMGRGGAIEKCDFTNFKSCRMEIVAGNRGFCRQNGYYVAKATKPYKARRHRARR